MIHFAVAFALLLHVLFWGAGLAVLAMPGRWRRFWPVLVFPAGLALQSAVVWFGALANFRGTNSYALWSEALPVGLAVLAMWRKGARTLWIDLQRIGLVWMAGAGCMLLLVGPLAWASKGLTTMSLGSCDAPDYAAGARVLQEFARTDRTGFLGLTEVVRVQSVDNFFDYWTRLNHFTPAALIAFNGSVLGCVPHELTSLLTMVLLAGSLPVVFWMARAVIGFGGGPSVAVAVLYGLSPLLWYVVGHVAMGQLLAAMAVALITWVGVAAWRGRLTFLRGAQFLPVLAVSYWLLLGSYNFFVVLCLVPAVAYAGGLAVRHGAWQRLAGWLGVMLAPLAVCAVVFFGRAAGLVERFRLLRAYDFGWKIPVLTPEGWLGLVSGPDLQPWRIFGLRWVLAGTVVGLLMWAAARAWSERRRKGWIAAAVTVPVLAGYAFLEWRGARLGTNASYDAFKLFTVFYPVMLPVFCWWVTLRWSRRLTEWVGVMGVAGVVLSGNLVGTGMIFWRMCAAPLIVDGELRQLRKVETMTDVRSINVLLPDMWSRLWANELLLRRPQYFATDTYEARWHTALRGDWDLQGGLIAVKPPGEGRRQVTPRLALVDTRGPQFLRASLADGWHNEEGDAASGAHWRWTKGDATIRIENPQTHPLTIVCTVDGWSIGGERDLALVAKPETTPTGVKLGTQRMKIELAAVTVPPGVSVLTLHSPQPATSAGPGDSRPLGVCVFGLELAVRPD